MAWGRRRLAWGALAALAVAIASPAAAADAVNRPPTEKDWLAIAKLPDWSGVWTPDVSDQMRQVRTEPLPWTPKVAQEIDRLDAEEKAGRPFPVLMGCLPHGMPALMMITHNAMEFLFTPGRVTLLGESDGNRLRRIYTDGRGHPEDPDETFHGHSIGRWEGTTLVVDTVAVAPQAWIAVSEAVGSPNNGGMRIVERLHLEGPDTLIDEMEITAPKVLTRPWKTTRKFYRQRSQKYDIVEGECVRGAFKAATDAKGDSVFVPIPLGADGGLSADR